MKGAKSLATHKVLRQFPYGLYAVGVRGKEGDINAFMGSWITQCSFDPPLILICVKLDTKSYQLLQKGRVFSINLLDPSEKVLARKLVKPTHRVGDKLGKVSHVEEDTGAPILREAFAYAECRVKSITKPGDHALVVGQVVNACLRKKKPTLTCADLKWHYAG